MLQPTSILLPFKKYSKKANIKYDPANSHQENQELAQFSFYPSLKYSLVVSNLKRKSSIMIDQQSLSLVSQKSNNNKQSQSPNRKSSIARKSSIKKTQRGMSIKQQPSSQQDPSQQQQQPLPKQSVRFSDLEGIQISTAVAEAMAMNNNGGNSSKNKSRPSSQNNSFVSASGARDAKDNSNSNRMSKRESMSNKNHHQSQVMRKSSMKQHNSALGNANSNGNNDYGFFEMVREESSSGTSSSEQESDTSESDIVEPQKKSFQRKSNDEKQQQQQIYGDFFQIQEEPPSQEQTITNRSSQSVLNEDDYVQMSEYENNQDNEEDDNGMEFEDNQEESEREEFRGHSQSIQSNKMQRKSQKKRMSKRLNKSNSFSKAIISQTEVAQLLDIINKQQQDLIQQVQLRKQSVTSSSSAQTDQSQIEIDGKIETIFKILGVQQEEQKPSTSGGDGGSSEDLITNLKQHVGPGVTELKRFSVYSHASSKQFMGYGPVIDCPSLISEQTGEDQKTSTYTRQSQQTLEQPTIGAGSISQQQTYYQQQQLIESINKDIIAHSNSNDRVGSSSHAQLQQFPNLIKSSSGQQQSQQSQQLPNIDLKKLQLQVIANQERHNQEMYEEQKKNKLLISQNQRLLNELKEAHTQIADQSAKIEKSLVLIQEFKNKIKAKNEEVQDFKEQYIKVKQKYSALKNRVDDTLIRVTVKEYSSQDNSIQDDHEDLSIKQSQQNSSLQIKKELKIENQFLQHQIYTLQNELSQMKKPRDQEKEYKEKILYYEGIIEDLTMENTKLIIKQQRLSDIKQEKEQLQQIMDKFKVINQKLSLENEDMKHKYDVSEKLRQQLKDQFNKYVQKHLDADHKMQNYENILLSQSYIERQQVQQQFVNNNNNLTYNHEDDTLNLMDDKSLEFIKHQLQNNPNQQQSQPQLNQTQKQFGLYATNKNINLESSLFIGDISHASPLKQTQPQQQMYGLFSNGGGVGGDSTAAIANIVAGGANTNPGSGFLSQQRRGNQRRQQNLQINRDLVKGIMIEDTNLSEIDKNNYNNNNNNNNHHIVINKIDSEKDIAVPHSQKLSHNLNHPAKSNLIKSTTIINNNLCTFSNKIKPQSGFKMPKLREGEQIIGFRPPGNTDIFSKPKNFNFELQRQNNEKLRFRIVKGLVLLSFIPIGLFVKNAEKNFRDAQVKQIAAKRRERLDQEHGINREQWKDSLQELDKMYRVSEKEEIQKYRQVGKTAEDYYKQKEAHDKPMTPNQQNQDNDNTSAEKTSIVQTEQTKDGMEVKLIKGETYEQVAVQQVGSSPDPRVAGPRIIFDSRLDKFQSPQETKEFIQQKQQELPPYTLDDKKRLLINMLKKKEQQQQEGNNVIDQQTSDNTVAVEQDNTQIANETKQSGFSRQKRGGFKSSEPTNKAAEAEPLFTPSKEYNIESDKEKLLIDVADKYNMIVNFLKNHDKKARDFLSFVIIKSIPNLPSLDYHSLEEFLHYIEHNYSQEVADYKTQTHLFKGENELYLKLKLAKNSLDVMIDQQNNIFHERGAAEHINIREAISQGLDSQVHEVRKVYSQMRKLEQDLNEGTIKMINTDKFAQKTLEQQQYTQVYSNLQHKLMEVQLHKPDLSTIKNQFQDKIVEVESFFTDLNQNGQQFKAGLRKILKNDILLEVSQIYLKLMSQEVHKRENMENKIKSDTKVILVDCDNILNNIFKYLEVDTKVFERLEQILQRGFSNGVMHDLRYSSKSKIDEKDFIFDKSHLFYEIMQNGTPDIDQIIDSHKKFSSKVLKGNLINRILQNFGQEDQSKSEFSSLYFQEMKDIEYLMRRNKLQEAHERLLNMKIEDHEQFKAQKDLIYKIEQRLYAESMQQKFLKNEQEKLIKRGLISD